jgi:hypothetical protein
VTVASFEAAAQTGSVLVTWKTASEVYLVGFNPYRGEAASRSWARLNLTIIPAQFPGKLLGGEYAYLDTSASTGAAYYYRLEGININGRGAFFGPVLVLVQEAYPSVYLPLVLR